jgi:hypothetical protein
MERLATTGQFGIIVTPAAGYLEERFIISVFGSPTSARKIKLRTEKPEYWRLNDPVFAERVGDGKLHVIGTTMLKGRELDPNEKNVVKVYATADMPLATDIHSASVEVELIPTPTEVPTEPGEGCVEGAYTADRKMVCSGGVWVPVGEEPGVRKYLTVEEANERVRMGLPCYIKCMLPILDMLPGFPYTPGAWVPPFCAITKDI